MVACALDDRDRAGITHPEALTRYAAEIAFAGGRAIKNGVAHDDRVLRRELFGFLRRVDDDAAAGQSLSDIVVCLPLKLECHAFGEEGAEALPRSALEFDVDCFVTQSSVPVAALGVRRHPGPGRPIGVAD